MEFLAKLFSFLSLSAGAQNSKDTLVIFLDEPECPK